MKIFKSKSFNDNSLLRQLRDFAGGPVIGVLISLVTVPIITRLLAPDELGKSSLFVLVQTLFSMIALFGLDQAYVRYFNSKDYRDKELLFNAIILPLLISIILLIGFVFFHRPLSYWLFDSYEMLIMVLLCPFLVSLIISRYSMLIIRMELRGKLYSTLSVMAQIINFLLLLLFLLLYERSFRSIVYAAIFGGLLNAAVPFWFCREKWSFNLSYYNKYLISKLLQFGLPLVPATALTWVLSSIDKINLKQWSTYEQLGMYSAAFKIAALLGVLQTIFTTAWIPVAYKWFENNEDVKKYTQVNDFVLTIFSIVFCLIVLFRDIIIMFLGPEYRGVSIIMIYLLFVPLMYTLSSSVAIGIDLKKKTIYNVWAVLAGVITCIIGNFFLIPVLGAKGAAISTAFSYIISFLFRMYFARMLWYKFSIKNIIAILSFIILLVMSVEFDFPRYFEIIVVGIIFIVNYFIIKNNISTKSKITM